MDRNFNPDQLRKIDPLATPEELQPEMMMPESDTAEPEAGSVAPAPEDHGPLLSPEETGDLRTQWEIIQTGFVDQPRRAVEQADSLVAEALERLTATFGAERTRLEAELERTGDVSTEDLRLALQRYRAFFHRLLAT